MTQSIIFDNIMKACWDWETADDFISTAVANTLRGRQRFNYENALEVLRLVYPDAKCTPRISEAIPEGEEKGNEWLVFDVEFADKSHCLITADKYGIANGVEWID